VADRATKAPFPRELRVAEQVAQRAREHGLVVWPNVGHADGVNGDLILIAPPLTIAHAQIDELVDLLRAALTGVAASLATGGRAGSTAHIAAKKVKI
jgi:adenosylmethionine-8-amino-7-oxononanoate aminotransferase